MSKGNSHLFSGTSGEGKALIEEVVTKGEKISPEEVVMITCTPNGKIVWLEQGNSSSGLKHIINRHGHEFNGKGIANNDIPNYILEAIYQGKRNPRVVYEFIYNKQKQRVAIQIGSNGYIVGANPKSTEDN